MRRRDCDLPASPASLQPSSAYSALASLSPASVTCSPSTRRRPRLRTAGRSRIERLVARRSPRQQGHRLRCQCARFSERQRARRGRDRTGLPSGRPSSVASVVAATSSRPRSRRPFSLTLSVTCSRAWPGSVRTGSRILAEIGDGTRFADGDKLASYAGLPPATRQSGKSLSGEVKSGRGNHRLKKRHVSHRVRLAAHARVQGLLRPKSAPRASVTTRH